MLPALGILARGTAYRRPLASDGWLDQGRLKAGGRLTLVDVGSRCCSTLPRSDPRLIHRDAFLLEPLDGARMERDPDLLRHNLRRELAHLLVDRGHLVPPGEDRRSHFVDGV